MTETKCPVCDGWKTTSRTPNLKNHLKKHAASELLRHFLINPNLIAVNAPHADFIRSHMKVVKRESIDILID